MKYHDITYDDMKNGDGLRVVLWIAGCNHHCKGCHNPVTWNPDDGMDFGRKDKEELFLALERDYISGITFSGGDPLYLKNRHEVEELAAEIKRKFPDKTIWIYTGYLWEEVKSLPVMKYTDVLVDGRFVEELLDPNYPWAGSSNQRVIGVQKSIQKGVVVLHENN